MVHKSTVKPSKRLDKKVLIIEDSPRMRALIADALSHAEYETHTAATGEAGLRLFFEVRPDLVILDLLLPGLDGWAVCQRLRIRSQTPIIILSALSEEAEIIRGLSLGALEYVTKPFSVPVLRARVEAILRHTTASSDQEDWLVYADDYLTIDVALCQATVRGDLVRLPPRGCQLLTVLLQHRDQVVSHETLLAEIWGQEYRRQLDYLHVYISQLRQKLEPDPAFPRYLLTKRGVGYLFKTH